MLEWLLALDGGILLWIQANLRGPLDTLVSGYTHLGDAGILWIVVTLVLLIFKRTRRAGAASALALILSVLCTNVVLKHLVSRPRPWLDVAGLVNLVNESDPNSFPSGHTSAALAAACAWWRTLPQRWMKWLAMVLAVLMGLSRLYVGVHYPSDVVVGALVGIFCGWAACKLLELCRGRLQTAKH
jgi:undecaprenyl-diphosphatase